MKTIILPTSPEQKIGNLPPNTRFTYNGHQWLAVDLDETLEICQGFIAAVNLSNGKLSDFHRETVVTDVEGVPEKPVTRFCDIDSGPFVYGGRMYLKTAAGTLDVSAGGTVDFNAYHPVHQIKTLNIELE